jgi:hypothetical protein
LEQLGVRNWRLMARDRVEWRTVVREAMVQLLTVVLVMMMSDHIRRHDLSVTHA